MKTIIVTGGSGYIGSAIVDLALKEGYVVYNIDIVSPLYKPNSENYRFIKFDLTNDPLQLINSLPENIDGLIHMAAFKDLPDSYNHPYEYYYNNIISTINTLYIATHLCKTKMFIFSSSAAVYDDELLGGIIEYHPVKGSSPYGYTKLVAERIITETCIQYGLSSFCLRYYNPIGGIKGVTVDDSDTMFGSVLNCIKYNKSFTIFGGDYDTKDGTCIRDYIDIRDIANVHIEFLKKDSELYNDIVNVGRGEGLSCLEACKLVKELYPEFKYEIGERRHGDSPGGYAITSKLKHTYNIDTKYSIKDSIRDIINIALS